MLRRKRKDVREKSVSRAIEYQWQFISRGIAFVSRETKRNRKLRNSMEKRTIYV